jgi:looped-hinge helix DNA binding domain, AbrB family
MRRKRGSYMESTGVVRKIDDLGRIVIPKEIRRTLKIKDGSSLEIFLDKDMVALKRHSSLNMLSDFAEIYVEAIYNSLKSLVIITDKDNIVAVGGTKKQEYTHQPISKFLDVCSSTSVPIREKDATKLEIIEGKYINCAYIINPIIANGQSVGLVIITNSKELREQDEKVAQVAAEFLARHIEE